MKELFVSVCDMSEFLNSNQLIIPVFCAIKVKHFDLVKNDLVALNNERLFFVKYEISAT